MMKRLFSIAIIAATMAGVTSAKVPEVLRRQSSDTDAMAFYDAMDEFEAANPDGITLVTYDSYPDGTKVISRRIDWNRDNNRAQLRICAVFDSITARPARDRIAVRNITGDNEVRVYKLKESDSDITIDFSGGTSHIGATSACINIGSGVVLAQNWTVRSGVPQGTPDLKNLNAAIAALGKEKDARKEHKVCNAVSQEYRHDGLRRREVDSSLDFERLILDKADVMQWINLHHVFMESLGADGNISLSYKRNSRMVSLIDMSTKTIYVACYSARTDNRGQLIILVGKYTGEPFLPDGWADAWKTYSYTSLNIE